MSFDKKCFQKLDYFLDNKFFRRFFRFFGKFKGYGFLSGVCVSVSINIFTGDFIWKSGGVSAILFLIAAVAFFYLDIVETEQYQAVSDTSKGSKDKPLENDEKIWGGVLSIRSKIFVIAALVIAGGATVGAIVVYCGT